MGALISAGFNCVMFEKVEIYFEIGDISSGV